MIPFFGSRQQAANREIIERLHENLVRATRQPAFYVAGEVPDSFLGRFELLVLHASLVVRRLRALPEPGPSMAQALVDAVFRHLDPALRELGVGDMAVPKRMKKFAESFLGRSVAYDAALAAGDAMALAAALHRNVYSGGRPAEDLASYVEAAAKEVGETPLETLAAGQVQFPDPAAFLRQTGAA